MTGMDVLMRCKSYQADMERMRLKCACVRDARTRVTRAMDAQGHGGTGDRMGELTAHVDALERGMQARELAYGMEVMEAARLVGEIDNAEIGAILYAHYVSGDGLAAIAVGRKMSLDSVRSYKRRGVLLMERAKSRLCGKAIYVGAREDENRALRLGKDPSWP